MIRSIALLSVCFFAATADARPKHKPRHAPKPAAAKHAPAPAATPAPVSTTTSPTSGSSTAAGMSTSAPSTVSESGTGNAASTRARSNGPRATANRTEATAEVTTSAPPVASPAATSREQIFEIAAEMTAVGRYFGVRQDLYGQFLAQEQPLLLLAGGRIAYYPLAHTSLVSRFRLALTGRFAYGLPAGTRTETGERSAITTWDASGAIRGDLRFGLATISLSAGAGGQSIQFGALPTRMLVPDATYVYLRPALEARFAFHKHVVVSASAGYRAILTAGGLSAALPRSTIHAIDGDVRLIIPIAGGFEASAFATYTRYFASINPQPGDRYVAGGFSDDWPGGGLSFAYTY